MLDKLEKAHFLYRQSLFAKKMVPYLSLNVPIDQITLYRIHN